MIRRKGWYKKAKHKWFKERIYSFELKTESSFFNSKINYNKYHNSKYSYCRPTQFFDELFYNNSPSEMFWKIWNERLTHAQNDLIFKYKLLSNKT